MTPVSATITLDYLLLNGQSFVSGGPPSAFHNLLGLPSRIIAAGPPAPHGHRNNQIHLYDSLGIFLNEHHYTYAIQSISFVLWPEESYFDVRSPFNGHLALGSLDVVGGLEERHLPESGLPLRHSLGGIWNAKGQVSISVEARCQKRETGRRSKVRSIATISVDLQHDPWSKEFRPATE